MRGPNGNLLHNLAGKSAERNPRSVGNNAKHQFGGPAHVGRTADPVTIGLESDDLVIRKELRLAALLGLDSVAGANRLLFHLFLNAAEHLYAETTVRAEDQAHLDPVLTRLPDGHVRQIRRDPCLLHPGFQEMQDFRFVGPLGQRLERSLPSGVR